MEIIEQATKIDIRDIISSEYKFDSGLVVKYTWEDLYIKDDSGKYVKLSSPYFYKNDFIKYIRQSVTKSNGNTSLKQSLRGKTHMNGSQSTFYGYYNANSGVSSDGYSDYDGSITGAYGSTSMSAITTYHVVCFPKLYIFDFEKQQYELFDGYTTFPTSIIDELNKLSLSDIGIILKDTLEYLSINSSKNMYMSQIIYKQITKIVYEKEKEQERLQEEQERLNKIKEDAERKKRHDKVCSMIKQEQENYNNDFLQHRKLWIIIFGIVYCIGLLTTLLNFIIHARAFHIFAVVCSVISFFVGLISCAVSAYDRHFDEYDNYIKDKIITHAEFNSIMDSYADEVNTSVYLSVTMLLWLSTCIFIALACFNL